MPSTASRKRLDGRITLALASWFSAAARDLPWRSRDPGTGRPKPWRVFVSELMLQQTQVSRVADRFESFMRLFPTPASMAKAPVERVLDAWAGLGYYRRARALHASARAIRDRHAGRVPAELGALRRLPGVGPYTAGAVASIAFGFRSAAVDGNVVRVLLRIDGRDGAADEPDTMRWAFERASSLQERAAALGVDAGTLTESLMELGATICTPARPGCAACPLRGPCAARANGRVDDIPRPKSRPGRRALPMTVLALRDSHGRWLMRRGGDAGLWAGLWHPPTVEGHHGRAAALRAAGLPRMSLAAAGECRRALSHRLVSFRVWAGELPEGWRPARAAWVLRSPDRPGGVSSAHKEALAMGSRALNGPT